ncbi:MAG: hypothetical protein LBJ00_16780 [Planctomycetaceae bacterium]|jgi:hypothetical protein|nr:hypothetical protein [Planctomycetaceae bacterium]
MRKRNLSILLVVFILGVGFVISFVFDDVFGQQPVPVHTAGQTNNQPLPANEHNKQLQIGNPSYPVAYPHPYPPTPNPPNHNNQVIVRPPMEPPKWLVDFTPIDDPANPAQKIMAITVVDPEAKRILIYHANLSFGALKFVSSRDILPDIMIGEYNAVSPTPREIIAEIERLKNSKQ